MAEYTTLAVHWEGLDIAVRYCAEWSPSYREVYGYPLAHLELRIAGKAFPVSETGYLSHFNRPDNIEAAGGLVEFVLALLTDACRIVDGKEREATSHQLSLF